MALMEPKSTIEPACKVVDSSFLRALLGYNTRRATLKIFDIFYERTDAFELNPIEFSVLHLIGRNCNISPSQLCHELALLPPNLTKILQKLSRKQLIQKYRPVTDKRAIYLKLSERGQAHLVQLEAIITKLERDAASKLTDKQLAQLIDLLQRIYK